jgi:hypothetical protein
MAWKLTIAGAEQTTQIWRGEPVTFDRTLNERATASFACRPSLLPSRLAEVILYAQDGTTPLFGGLIQPGGRSGKPVSRVSSSMRTSIECGDFFMYLDWVYVSLAYTDGPTLKAVLADIVDELDASLGVTLDAGQVDGPTLEPFAWVNKKASEAVRELSERTGYVAQMSPGKALRMQTPGTEAAPFSITDAAWHCDELEWADVADVAYNTVVLSCGPSGTGVYEQRWTVAGAETSWVADLPAPGPGGYWHVFVNETEFYTIGTATDPGQFNWDWATHTLTRNTAPALTAGDVIRMPYTVQFPFVVRETSGATPPVELLLAYPDVTEYHHAVEIAEGLLTRLNQPTAREITIYTREHGLAPGQALTVDLDARGVSGSFVITAISATLTTDRQWYYVVTAIESSTYAGSYLDEWRRMSGGTGTASSVVIGSGMTPIPYSQAGSDISVRDFGATGDGSTDDAAAIQQAIDAAKAAVSGYALDRKPRVFFPAGRYRLASGLVLEPRGGNTGTDRVSFAGVGRHSSTLLPDSGVSALTLSCGEGGLEGIVLEQLGVEGGADGIVIEDYDTWEVGLIRCAFRDLYFSGQSRAGLYAAHSEILDTDFARIFATGCQYGAYIGSDANNVLTLTQCQFRLCTAAGLYVANPDAVKLINVLFESNEKHGLMVHHHIGLDLDGAWFENNGTNETDGPYAHIAVSSGGSGTGAIRFRLCKFVNSGANNDDLAIEVTTEYVGGDFVFESCQMQAGGLGMSVIDLGNFTAQPRIATDQNWNASVVASPVFPHPPKGGWMSPRYGTFTMPAAAIYTNGDSTANTGSSCVIFPMNAAAVTLQRSASALYFYGGVLGEGFQFRTADGGNAAGTEVFSYVAMR